MQQFGSDIAIYNITKEFKEIKLGACGEEFWKSNDDYWIPRIGQESYGNIKNGITCPD